MTLVRPSLDAWAGWAIDAIPADVRDAFGVNPRSAMASVGLTVHALDGMTVGRTEGGSCDGVSFLRDGIVLYVATPNSRRENFTLGHELGHWAVERTPPVLDALADQDEPGVLLEAVCDRIARRLLLPDVAVATIVGAGPVRAEHVLDLYDATNASRQACAVAVASSMVTLGAVVLIDQTSHDVTFASVQPDPELGWPTVFPLRHQEVPPGHPLRSMHPGQTTTQATFWRAPWGAEQRYFVDAHHDGRRIVAVLSADDLWLISRLHIEEPRAFFRRHTRRSPAAGRHAVPTDTRVKNVAATMPPMQVVSLREGRDTGPAMPDVFPDVQAAPAGRRTVRGVPGRLTARQFVSTS